MTCHQQPKLVCYRLNIVSPISPMQKSVRIAFMTIVVSYRSYVRSYTKYMYALDEPRRYIGLAKGQHVSFSFQWGFGDVAMIITGDYKLLVWVRCNEKNAMVKYNSNECYVH